jgi:multidrug efflux pump subunit AcrA (membrane-fusion protein)
MRKFLVSLLGIIIIAIGFWGMKAMENRERKLPPKEDRAVPIVYTEIVKNASTPITITASGNLAARDRIELYSEVQGIFENSARTFKPGIYYEQGDILLQINSDEDRASLKSQKSTLFNQIVAILPDLKFDYPEAYPKWQEYVNKFDINKAIPNLPKASSDKEKLYVAGKNISTAWYSVKNIEERLRKYTIYAPFNGILTEATVDKGALIRSGQKLGEFINPNIYELEVAVNSSFADLLKIGNTVKLRNVENTKSWTGKVNRVNSLIDPNTQTVQAYIRVNGKGLREGMYLEAELNAKQEDNTYKISRKLIVENDKVFVFEENKLKTHEINAVHYTDTEAIVRGLPDGIEILSKNLPGAYEGMEVKHINEIEKSN